MWWYYDGSMRVPAASETEARQRAEEVLDAVRAEARVDDGWPDWADTVAWGFGAVVRARAREVVVAEHDCGEHALHELCHECECEGPCECRSCGCSAPPGVDWLVDYRLEGEARGR